MSGSDLYLWGELDNTELGVRASISIKTKKI